MKRNIERTNHFALECGDILLSIHSCSCIKIIFRSTKQCSVKFQMYASNRFIIMNAGIMNSCHLHLRSIKKETGISLEIFCVDYFLARGNAYAQA